MYFSWILGDVIGFIRMNFSYYGFLVSWLLIATLSTLKLTILKFPLRAKTWDTRHGHMICTTIWALGIASPVQFFIIGWDDIFFDYRIYLTDYKFSAPIWEWYLPLCTVIMSVLPLLTVAITTIPTLMILNNARKVAKKSRGRVRWQGIITVVFTATFHSLSTFPSVIYMVGYLTVGWGDFDIQFKRCSMFVVILNVTSNFYIYSLTVRSFQDFIKKKFLNRLYMITPAPSDVTQETPLDERSTIVRRGSTMTWDLQLFIQLSELKRCGNKATKTELKT